MINEFFYYNPVKIVFGEGKLQEAGKYAQMYGKKALIVTTGTLFKENGLVDRLQKILKGQRRELGLLSGSQRQPAEHADR